MHIGIIGLSAVGKTTLFNLLTQAGASTGFGSRDQTNIGIARVPDARSDWLSAVYHPRKTTHATIEFTDIPGLVPGEDRKKLNEFFEGVRDGEALVLVVRAFENPAVPPALGEVDPYAEADTVATELVFADLDRVASLVERMAKARKLDKDAEQVAGILDRCLEVLEQGRPLLRAGLADEEQFLLRGYQLLTLKPVILAVNLDEEALRRRVFTGHEELREYAEEQGMTYMEFSGVVEEEIAQLPAGDRGAFMAEYGIEESGIDRLARVAYACLGLIPFFTVGEDEVRAWTIHRGLTARQAAGKIHTDIEHGFIRAEVVSYEDFRQYGSMKEARNHGRVRLEGKDYIVQDGDIIDFRFNV